MFNKRQINRIEIKLDRLTEMLYRRPTNDTIVKLLNAQTTTVEEIIKGRKEKGPKKRKYVKSGLYSKKLTK